MRIPNLSGLSLRQEGAISGADSRDGSTPLCWRCHTRPSSAGGKLTREGLPKARRARTTLRISGQQWDAPNGWAPAQWMAFAGLKRYKLDSLAELIRERWLKLNLQVFRSTGKLMEKYNVINLDLMSGGGEYPLQDGFGWTNGVYRALSTPEESLNHLTHLPRTSRVLLMLPIAALPLLIE